MPAHDSRSWDANDELLVRLGNVNSVSMKLNGRHINPQVGSQKAVNDILLTKDSLKDASLFPPEEAAPKDEKEGDAPDEPRQ